MSSYLSFYLVPSKRESDNSEREPLLLNSYGRGCELYRVYMENLAVAYCDDEDHPYSELTEQKSQKVISAVSSEIDKIQRQLSVQYKILKNSSVVNNDVTDRISELEEQLHDLEETLKEVQFFHNLITDFKYGSDFEKILINYDS